MMYEELIKKLRFGTKCFPGYVLYLDGGIQPFYFTPKDLEQAAEAIEDLDNKLNLYRQGKISRWIPVTERLPGLNNVVQITDGIDVGHGYLTSITTCQDETYLGWYSPFCDINEDNVTHWMPLPKPPEEKS